MEFTMKKTILFGVLVFFCSGLTPAQDYQNIELSPTKFITLRHIVFDDPPFSTEYLEGSGTYDVGYDYIPGTAVEDAEDVTWRTIYKLDLSGIPSNAIITIATLTTWTNRPSSQFFVEFFQLPDDVNPQSCGSNQQCLSDRFAQSASGTSIRTHAYDDTLNTSVTNYIQHRLSYNYAVFGGGGAPSGGYDNSPAKTEMRLAITYYLPYPTSVTIDQKLSAGSSIDSIGRWEGGPNFVPYAAPSNLTFGVPSTEVLRGAQKILSGEKYNKWIRGTQNEVDVKNHHVFPIQPGFPGNVTSQFEATTQGAVIKAESIESPGVGGTLEFKDPWLIDYPDPNYGNNLRNQGMSAPFKNRTSPFYPDLSTSYGGDVYNGAFLDQLIQDGVYYSVRAPIVQAINGSTVIFQGWIYDPNYATVTQVEPNPSGYDQKAVVFKQANATITARYSSTITTNVTISPEHILSHRT
jgi:hypothetical protein